MTNSVVVDHFRLIV